MKKASTSSPTTSASIITDVNTVDISTIGPVTRSKALRQPLVPDTPPPLAPFNWQFEETLRKDMIQTVRDFQELFQPESITHTLDSKTLAEDTCNSILAQVESQTIQVSLKALMSVAPSITDHI